MTFYLLLLSWLTLGLGANFAPQSVPASVLLPSTAQSVEACRIYGSIYLETDPRWRSYCFATVYLEPDEAFADVLVFKESNKLFADKAGFWYFTMARDFADYALFVTDNRNLADFSIHYTDVRSYAGCRKQ
ncbi:hypothetical protein SAMN00120144_1487 [Hymenobacter roseosalivarius DSM 11622]|uniref:7(1) septoil knot domain-containing protein n=1 Tax=Hymenobacter roseosalivarius DSM 11622 TaxID=645990 RepID=A0A1W1V1F2_9BACT|nr:DUF6150 family protein [Hymenobacter roseosalivarius]SMB87146.1 hypothetical protein SAMN00120144_1487 [Hymenobacter roseosalivarius DSM 11622]